MDNIEQTSDLVFIKFILDMCHKNSNWILIPLVVIIFIQVIIFTTILFYLVCRPNGVAEKGGRETIPEEQFNCGGETIP
jgi:hypothetical protein